MPAARTSVFDLLRNMCVRANADSRAFRADYAALTSHVVRVIQAAAQTQLQEIGSYSDGESATALHCAASCGCLEACDLLLQRCPSLILQVDSLGRSPLHWAAGRGLNRTSDLLLQHGASGGSTDARGYTPLHLAAAEGFPQVVALLLDKHADVSATCEAGRTPLHLGAARGSVAVCRVLVLAGAAQSATDESGRTALQFAASDDHAVVAAYLAEEGNDDEVAEALDVALAAGSHAAVDALKAQLALREWEVRQWASDLAGWPSPEEITDNETSLVPTSGSALDISVPRLQHVRASTLDLVCRVTDLDYRVLEYVLEVRDCTSRTAAAPGRLYYARLGEQRKVDDVTFKVPMHRANGCAVWAFGRSYAFRLTGRCARLPPSHNAPWHVVSSWSEVTPALRMPRKRERRSTRGVCSTRSLV